MEVGLADRLENLVDPEERDPRQDPPPGLAPSERLSSRRLESRRYGPGQPVVVIVRLWNRGLPAVLAREERP